MCVKNLTEIGYQKLKKKWYKKSNFLAKFDQKLADFGPKKESHENDLGWKMVQVCQKENGLGFQNNKNIDRKMVQVFKIFKI